jgi:Protein of unknown function (DUF1698)
LAPVTGSTTARARRAALTARRLAGGMSLSRRQNLVSAAPSPQQAIDAVPDSWASRFPPPLSHLRAGEATLFEDPRISWAFERLGGMQGKTVLDLGPLEGAHSYMAERAGASRVVGVEANRMAFLKCLVTKELLELRSCSFLCGEVIQYLSDAQEPVDVCIACGILYHMTEPVRLIDLISRSASQMIIWTHIYDEAALSNPNLAGKLSGAQEVDYNGFHHQVHRHSYGIDSRLGGFFGGTQPYSSWLPRAELMRALAHFGWKNIEVAFEELSHPNGPSLALVAERH